MTDPRKRLTAVQYAKAKAAGLTDDQIREDGYDPPESSASAGTPSTTPASPEEDAAYKRASRYATRYGMADAALRAATFGFGDEIRSGIGAAKDVLTGAGDFGPSYRGRERAELEGMERFAEESPWQDRIAALGGSVAGALGTGGPVGQGLARLAGRGARGVFGAVRAGAVYGGVTGVGEGTGGAGSRLASGVIGAGVGGAAGAAVHEGVSLVNAIRGAITRSAEQRASARAAALINDRLRQSGETVSSVRARAAGSRSTGKPDALLDIGGTPVTVLARDATGFPTEGGARLTEFVTRRLGDQPERIVGDLAKTGGMTRVSTPEAVIELVRQRNDLAAPMYDAIRDLPVEHPQLRQLFELPDFRKAYGLASKIADRYAALGEGQKLPSLDALFPPLSASTALSRGATVVDDAVPPMKIGTLDQVKQALDEILYTEKNKMGPQDRASLQRVRHALVLIGDDATRDGAGRSAYQEARRVFEGPSKLIEQLEEGGSHFLAPKTTAADVAARLRVLGDTEREAYKASVLDAVSHKLDGARSGRDVTRVLDTPATDKKLRLLFAAPEQYAAWRDAFLKERGYSTTRDLIVGGSRTTPMAAGMADIAAGPDALLQGGARAFARSLSPIASTAWSLSPVARALWQRFAAAHAGVRSAATADALAQKLRTEVGDNTFEALMQELEQAGVKAAASSRLAGPRARIAGVFSATRTR